MAEKTEFIESGGNIFADLGLPDAEELDLKAQLAINLKRLMEKHGLKQREIAERCGTDQPTISKILRGQLDIVTVERLVRWHSLLNQDISIVIRDDFRKEDSAPSGHVQVSTC